VNLIDLNFQSEGQTNMVPGKLCEKRGCQQMWAFWSTKPLCLTTAVEQPDMFSSNYNSYTQSLYLFIILSSHWYGIFKFPIVYGKHYWFSVIAYVARYSYFLHQFQKPCCYIQQQNPFKCRLPFFFWQPMPKTHRTWKRYKEGSKRHLPLHSHPVWSQTSIT